MSASLKLYIDSSVWNAVFDAHAPQLQSQTHAFLQRAQNDVAVAIFVSDVVVQELGNAPVARISDLFSWLKRLGAVRLALDAESSSLAEQYISHGVLTVGHRADAQHVAVATVAALDVIVSWNYRHLVNRRRREAFNGVNAICGYNRIEILSPPEVFGE